MATNTQTERFAQFTGWELQAIARGVSSAEPFARAPESVAAFTRLRGEIHREFDAREQCHRDQDLNATRADASFQTLMQEATEAEADAARDQAEQEGGVGSLIAGEPYFDSDHFDAQQER
jgi:hypothetical protein